MSAMVGVPACRMMASSSRLRMSITASTPERPNAAAWRRVSCDSLRTAGRTYLKFTFVTRRLYYDRSLRLYRGAEVPESTSRLRASRCAGRQPAIFRNPTEKEMT